MGYNFLIGRQDSIALGSARPLKPNAASFHLGIPCKMGIISVCSSEVVLRIKLANTCGRLYFKYEEERVSLIEVHLGSAPGLNHSCDGRRCTD